MLPSLERSKGLQYVTLKGWGYAEAGTDQICIDVCPLCHKEGGKFYMAIGGSKDSLWDCKKCQKSGNLQRLQELLGDRLPNVESRQEWGNDKQDPLPDPVSAHDFLINNEENADILDYLISERGYTMDAIKQQLIGASSRQYFPELKRECRAIVIPYLVNGKIVWAKYRTIPPDLKAFANPRGWDAPLYNQDALKPSLDYILIVEGEGDALALLSAGEKNVVGIPGASMKKAEWITLLDEYKPAKIFILFDNDKAGRDGKKALSSRILGDGTIPHQVYDLALPPFKVTDDDGNERDGKDLNDWLRHGGGTLSKLHELMEHARLFDVDGVMSGGDALSALERDLEGREDLSAKYQFPWVSLNRKVGGMEDGDVCDILAKEKVGKTVMSLNIVDWQVATYGEPGIIICLEMSQVRLARKWVSHVTQTDDSPTDPEKPEEAKLKLEHFLKVAIPQAREILRNRKADLLFAYPTLKERDPQEIYDLIRQVVRRYGVKFVVIDNLQLLADRTLKNDNHRTIHLSKISKSLAGLAKDLHIVMYRILQPHRVKDGTIVDSDNADGSSQIAKDCDLSLALHRHKRADIKEGDFEQTKFLDEDIAFEPELLVRAGLSRYAGGGVCTLKFIGETSTVTEITREEREKLPALPTGGTVPMEKPVIAPTVGVSALQAKIAAAQVPLQEV